MSKHDPYEMLREALDWINSFACSCVGADEMADRITACLQARPASGAELAELHGFKPHTPPPGAKGA